MSVLQLSAELMVSHRGQGQAALTLATSRLLTLSLQTFSLLVDERTLEFTLTRTM